jgi:steroid delta-isomerase-like uncharacterized protein
MAEAEIRDLLDRFVAAWVRLDIPTLLTLYTPDCKIVSPVFHEVRGTAQMKHSYEDLFAAFDAPTIRVEEIVIDGGGRRAVLVWTSQTTHRGEIFGMAGTGRRLEARMVFVFTFRDGRIASEVRVYDFTRVLLQLGILKATA